MQIAAPSPALLTNTSMRAKRLIAASTVRATSAFERTSPRMVSTRRSRRGRFARAFERNDERAVLEEAGCERAADPTSCAGDHHDFALERLHDVMSLLST